MSPRAYCLVQTGVPLNTVRDLLGHNSVAEPSLSAYSSVSTLKAKIYGKATVRKSHQGQCQLLKFRFR